MCRLNTFCCGCSLRAGAITAAVITMVNVILAILSAAMFFKQGADSEKAGNDEDATSYRASGGIYILGSILGIIIFICLSLALKKHRAGFVMPWLVCTMIQIVLLAINIILSLLVTEYVTLIAVPFWAFLIYLWVVVLNFHRDLREGGTGHHAGAKV